VNTHLKTVLLGKYIAVYEKMFYSHVFNNITDDIAYSLCLFISRVIEVLSCPFITFAEPENYFLSCVHYKGIRKYFVSGDMCPGSLLHSCQLFSV